MLGEVALLTQQYNIKQLQVHFVSNHIQCATVVLQDGKGNKYEDLCNWSR
ncbi:hypothetical protein ACUC2M_19005 [Bacillus cytotoxicus]